MKMRPKPINLTSKSTSEWILLIKLYTEQKQTSLIAVKSFVVLSGLQGNSSQVCEVKLFNISLKVSIQMYFLMLN